MEEALRRFKEQFSWKPVIENGPLSDSKKFIVVGMGGSNLAADLVKILRPDLDIAVHRDYGLPQYIGSETLVILSSYSGNTEEVIDAYKEAGRKNLKRVAIGAGGELLKRAVNDGVPYLKFPDDKIQPRIALGYSLLALLKTIGDEKLLNDTAHLAKTLSPEIQEKEGKKLAEKLKDFTPIIYASYRNKGLSYVWKIVFNETGKIPAFANVFPELNHNEMIGFSAERGQFFFLFLKDKSDNPRILKRMEVLKDLLDKKGFHLEVLELQGSPLEKLFSSFLLVNWTAYELARSYGVEPEAVPMIEEFKKLIK